YVRLEYGFPSTHSANSVSIALFILTHLLTMDHNMTLWMKYLYLMGLFFYCASIVCGRIYCGMHSICGKLLNIKYSPYFILFILFSLFYSLYFILFILFSLFYSLYFILFILFSLFI